MPGYQRHRFPKERAFLGFATVLALRFRDAGSSLRGFLARGLVADRCSGGGELDHGGQTAGVRVVTTRMRFAGSWQRFKWLAIVFAGLRGLGFDDS